MSGSRVIGLLGPTGAGKTRIAVELARLWGIKVISCDSMQVYAGFPVLTNQPIGREEAPELHALVGFVDPGRTMSAGEYAARARPLIDRQVAEQGRALVVGGSGLYMRAALAPLAALGPPDHERRDELERRAREEGPGGLHAELARLDPEAAGAIDPRNVRRLVRALESLVGQGAKWSGRQDLWEPAYDHPTLVVAVSLDRAVLAERIRARSEKMLVSGAVDEVKRFCEKRGPEATTPGLAGICSAIGYEEIWRYLRGESSHQETAERISSSTRGYARRQTTWLRKLRDAVMIDVQGRDASEVARGIARLSDSLEDAKEPHTI